MTHAMRMFALGAIVAMTIFDVHADDRRIHLSIELDKAVIGPGEAVKVSVFGQLSYEPGTKLPYTYQGQVYEGTLLAYGSTQFDLHALTGVVQGTYSNFAVHSGFNNNGYVYGEPEGNSIFNVNPSQTYPGSPMIAENPIFLYSVTWTPQEYLAATVEFELEPYLGLAAFAVPDLKPYPPTFFAEKWEVTASGASLTIIPSPGVAFAIFGVIGLMRRCRRG